MDKEQFDAARFEKGVAALGLNSRDHGMMLIRMRHIVPDEPQNYTDSFYNIVETVQSIAAREKRLATIVLANVVTTPSILLAVHGLSTKENIRPTFDRSRAIEAISPATRIELTPKYQAGHEKISPETRDMISAARKPLDPLARHAK